MDAYTEEHGYFQVDGRHLYGTWYKPAEVAPRRSVVVCEPFGEEKRCAFRMLVRLARRLASGGTAVLRFDVSGTGDSSCAHGEVDWKAWSQETVEAVRLAREWSETPRCVMLGARAGALLAAQMADAESVIVVEPVLSGDELLRDLERRQKIKDVMGGIAESASADERWSRGEAVDFGGFEVGAEMATQLKAVSLEQELERLSEVSALQVLRVSGSKKWPPAWSNIVAKAEGRAHSSAAIIQDKPFWGQLDYYESDLVNDAIVAHLEGLPI
jgi:pimeloyl-ACP methyl ester carboxylesterase